MTVGACAPPVTAGGSDVNESFVPMTQGEEAGDGLGPFVRFDQFRPPALKPEVAIVPVSHDHSNRPRAPEGGLRNFNSRGGSG